MYACVCVHGCACACACVRSVNLKLPDYPAKNDRKEKKERV